MRFRVIVALLCGRLAPTLALAIAISVLAKGSPALAQSMEEQRAWEHARAIGTLHEYEVFLGGYPSSVYGQDAMSAWSQLSAEQAAALANSKPHTLRKNPLAGKDGGNKGTRAPR